jgi:hypothetical protein
MDTAVGRSNAFYFPILLRETDKVVANATMEIHAQSNLVTQKQVEKLVYIPIFETELFGTQEPV